MKKILTIAAIAVFFIAVAVACESAPSAEAPATDSSAVCCAKDTTAPVVKADSIAADTTKK